jgi:histidinol phosphatase-like enzyme (inositol monophosphatase family)
MTRNHLGGLDPAVVLSVLEDAAAAAAGHTLPRFRTALAVDNKLSGGFDPVTEADREAERVVREVIAARFPDHGIVGEELDDKTGDSPYTWIVDPIDGTRAFIAGVPVWGTLIGLMHNGRAVAGLMAQPFTGELYASVGGKAWYRRGPERTTLRTSAVTSLATAKMTATSPDIFALSGTLAPWDAIRGAVRLTRYGLDCYGYCLLAAGHLDLVVEAALKDVDICPLIPIIESAGGIVTTWTGAPAEQGGNCIAAATPELHAEALRLLAT